MDRDRLIFNSLIKLANANKRLVNEIIRDLDKIYRKHKNTDYNDAKFPKDIVAYMQNV